LFIPAVTTWLNTEQGAHNTRLSAVREDIQPVIKASIEAAWDHAESASRPATPEVKFQKSISPYLQCRGHSFQTHHHPQQSAVAQIWFGPSAAPSSVEQRVKSAKQHVLNHHVMLIWIAAKLRHLVIVAQFMLRVPTRSPRHL
jgi:hypothetical protein